MQPYLTSETIFENLCISVQVHWKLIYFLYRTSDKIRSKIYRNSMNVLPGSYRSSIEILLKFFWSSIGIQWKSHWESLEILSKVYRQSIEIQSKFYLSKFDGSFIGQRFYIAPHPCPFLRRQHPPGWFLYCEWHTPPTRECTILLVPHLIVWNQGCLCNRGEWLECCKCCGCQHCNGSQCKIPPVFTAL